jgi:cytochrome c peroxidase
MSLVNSNTAGKSAVIWPALAFTVALAAPVASLHAQWPASCPGYTQCPIIDSPKVENSNPGYLAVDRENTREEYDALVAGQNGHLTRQQLKVILGQAEIYDPNLSVRRNEACASCHSQKAGFTGGVPIVNATTASYPGSFFFRTGNRKPQSYAYATFAPILHYRASTGDFVGGAFWDDRATGLVTGDPLGDQAMGPPTNPNEMALADSACAIYRIAHGLYATIFARVWGTGSLAIRWPANTAKICSQPNDGGPNQTPVGLSAADRQTADAAYTDMALAMAAYESSSAVVPFSSKFDAYLAGRGSLTANELQGYALFLGKGKCTQCHVATGKQPLFTDFTAVNIGIPKNPNNPYFYESAPDTEGFVSNPNGTSYIDNGVGAFLASSGNPQWAALAPKFIGTFQVATARNAAADEPIRAYMHNGFFKSLKQVVHFYNTRDVLPACQDGTGVFGLTCWPAPEQAANLNTTQTGNLHLTSQEEDDIVDFLRTLTDGYTR